MIKIMKINYQINRKAILMPETLKILLAVLGLVLLVVLSFKLYDIFIGKSDVEKARAHLDILEGKINALMEEEDGGSFDYVLYNPEGWALVGWPHQNLKPDYCTKKNWEKCLCICNLKLDIEKRLQWIELLKERSPSGVKDRCDETQICVEISASTFYVNRVGILFKLFININADMRPIFIGKLDKNSNSDLRISYDKTSDILEIEVK